MAGNCMCDQAGVLIFPCSGGSDVGELSDKAARKIAGGGQAKMFCLAGIGARIPGMIESTKAASKVIAIDGCQVQCSKKILEQTGFKPVCYNLKDMGFEKGKTQVSEENIGRAVSQIAGGKSEKTASSHPGNCCGC